MLILGRLDISGIDYLTSSVTQAFRADSAQQCADSSGLVRRLNRGLASELIKSMKSVPEFQFKVQGYVESCARQGVAPRGRAVVHMISRHFDLDRVRGSLLTQPVFLVELNGRIPSVRFAGFLVQPHDSSQLNANGTMAQPKDAWEFLLRSQDCSSFGKSDKIKNSIENRMRGEFDYLSDKLQEFLVQCRNVRIWTPVQKNSPCEAPRRPISSSGEPLWWPVTPPVAAAVSAPKPKGGPNSSSFQWWTTCWLQFANRGDGLCWKFPVTQVSCKRMRRSKSAAAWSFKDHSWVAPVLDTLAGILSVGC